MENKLLSELFTFVFAVFLVSFSRIKIANINVTSRPAIAGNPLCSVCKLWQKYKCEKRASNIALSYSIDVDK